MGKSKRTKRTKRKINKYKLLKLTCKNFNKPLYIMRHLNTDANLVSDSFIVKAYKSLKKHKGGSLKHFLPIIPGKEPTITYWGRNDVKKLPKKYGIHKTENSEYIVIVSPLMRTWLSSLLFIRALMKEKPFTLTLLITPIIEKKGYTGNTPLEKSYERFMKEVKENESIIIKYCNNINRKKYTCSIKTADDITKMYNTLQGKKYRSFEEGGFKLDETLYMISKSCKKEFNNMKDILVYTHGGLIRNYLNYIDYSKDKITQLKEINGYAIVCKVTNNNLSLDIKLP